MRVGAVVLAAGASKRLGAPKQLVRLGPETLLERAVRVAREAGCLPVVVVLGASAASIQAASELGDALVVVNEDWAEGMGSSIRVGLRVLADADACVVMTCDMPAVTCAHLRLLMASGEMTASSYAGRRGVPAYFPVGTFQLLLELHGDGGAKDLLRSARCVELSSGELDVDTVEDLRRAQELFG
jgi:molybdenum cofactor cytidylyltransferase